MKNWFMNLSLDKWLHIIVCAVIACAVALLDVAEFDRPIAVASAIGAIAAFLIGLLKEIVWDFILGKGTADVNDLIADFVGSLIGFIFVWVSMGFGGY